MKIKRLIYSIFITLFLVYGICHDAHAKWGSLGWNQNPTFAGLTIQTGGQLLLPDGSTTSLSITWTDDTNNGWYRSAADTIRMTIAGTDQLEYDNVAFQGIENENFAIIHSRTRSSTSPIYTFKGDTDTGAVGSADDSYTIVAGSVEIMTFVEAASDFVYTPSGIAFGVGTDTLTTEMEIWEDGTKTAHFNFDNVTASATALSVWDSRSDSLQQVLTDADDSAGPGFKYVIMAN